MSDLEFDKNLKKAITAEQRNLQRKYLQNIETSLKTEKKRNFNWRIAASIAILVGFSSFFLLINNTPSNNELYNNYFSAYENVVEPIVRDQTELTEKAKVFRQYEIGDYKNAITGFNKLSAKNTSEITTHNFYKANAYLQLEEFEKAKTLFNLIIQNKNEEWQAESLWYLSLIAIKENDKNSALEFLQKIKKENKKEFKNKEIEDLLNNLN